MRNIDKNEIDRLLREGLVTAEQAKKMMEDVVNTKSQYSSNLTITVISIIGSGLIGLGALFFIKSYWGFIPEIVKIGILFLSSIAAYAAGYYCKYRRKTMPIVGGSLLLLGALLFGATVFATGRMYGMSLWGDERLYLIWLLGTISALYAFSSVPIAALAVLIFFRILNFLPNRIDPYVPWNFSNTTNTIGGSNLKGFLSMIIGAIVLYSLGSFHYCWERFKKIGLVYKIGGFGTLFVGVPAIFFVDFQMIPFGILPFDSSAILFLGAIVPSVGLVLYTYYCNPEEKEIHLLELVYTLAFSGVVFFTAYFPLSGSAYGLIISSLFTQIIFLQMFYNYIKGNTVLFSLLVISLYEFIFIFFWGLGKSYYISRTIFLIFFGAVLVTAGLMLERKRKEGKTFSLGELRSIKIIFLAMWVGLFGVLAFFILMK